MDEAVAGAKALKAEEEGNGDGVGPPTVEGPPTAAGGGI